MRILQWAPTGHASYDCYLRLSLSHGFSKTYFQGDFCSEILKGTRFTTATFSLSLSHVFSRTYFQWDCLNETVRFFSEILKGMRLTTATFSFSLLVTRRKFLFFQAFFAKLLFQWDPTKHSLKQVVCQIHLWWNSSGHNLVSQNLVLYKLVWPHNRWQKMVWPNRVWQKHGLEKNNSLQTAVRQNCLQFVVWRRLVRWNLVWHNLVWHNHVW